VIEFGDLLRDHRAAARLTQEQLAVLAGLSLDAVSALERGARRAPRRATVFALADALRLDRLQREALVDAARRSPDGRPAKGAPLLFLPPPTRLVGRRTEIARLRAWFARPDVRLVTLTGPPGVGKTRLAQELCRDLDAEFDGTFGVPLAGLTNDSLVASAICQAIGVREDGRQGAAVDVITRFCQDRNVLVMLDNFEHLLDAAPLLAELLPRCPGLRLLVTSRASLRIRGEHEFPLAPLPLPEPGWMRPEVLAEVPAVELFVDRAQAAALDFALTPVNAPVIADICRHLDGLPLALELAAPWIKLLTARGLLEQLQRRAGLDLEGSRDLPERQRTMASTLAWSCDLLRPDERALFRRLAVFAGSAPLGGIESVCQAAGSLTASTTRLLGVLGDHHLIQRQTSIDDEPRTAMLVTVREYGLTLLRESGEAEVTERAHAEHYCALVARAAPELIGPKQRAWFRHIEMELDNIRGALAWAQVHDVEAGLRTVSRLGEFWETCGRGREGLSWVERLLELAADVPPAARAAAQEASGLLAARLGEYDLSRRRHEESLALSRDLGDRQGVAAAAHGMGLLHLWKGQMAPAERLLDEALSIRRAIDDSYGTAITLNLLGIVASEMGDELGAMRRYGESLSIYRLIGNRVGICRCLLNLGVSARRIGDLEQSARSLEEALAIARELDAPELLGATLVNLGNVPRSRGDVATARSLYAESIRVFAQLADHRWIAYTLECLAWLAWSERDPRRAVRIYGAAAGLRDRFGLPGWPVSFSEHAEAVTTLRAELAGAAFDVEYEAGRRLPLAEGIAEAVAGVD
jgi:predicted ATPase/transcriptional regulator with XRE-family HTH domain